MEQLMRYNEEILDYLKKGYKRSLYRNPENGSLMVKAIKGVDCAARSVNLTNNESLGCPQNYMYALILENLRHLERMVNI